MRILAPHEQNAVELAIAEAATAQSIAAERARLFDKQRKRITKAEAAAQPKLRNLSYFVKEEQRERRRVQLTEESSPPESHTASADAEQKLSETAPKHTASSTSWSSMSWWGWPADDQTSSNGSQLLFDRENGLAQVDNLPNNDENSDTFDQDAVMRAQRCISRRGRSRGAGTWHSAQPSASELRERARDRFFAPSPRAYFSKLTPRVSVASSVAPSPREYYASDFSSRADSVHSSRMQGTGSILPP